MPYANHLRVTARGVFGSVGAPLEEFSYGLNMSNPGNAVMGSGDFDDVVADISAFHSDFRARIWSGAILTEIKVAYIGADGRYTRDALIADVNVPGFSPGSVPQYPLQVALAVSLGTGQRGASKRGRFYLPAPTMGLAAGAIVSQAHAEDARAAVQSLVQNLNNWPTIDFTDPKVTIASSKGFNTDVVDVRVGRVLDTIRTRRRQLDETYTDSVGVN